MNSYTQKIIPCTCSPLCSGILIKQQRSHPPNSYFSTLLLSLLSQSLPFPLMTFVRFDFFLFIFFTLKCVWYDVEVRTVTRLPVYSFARYSLGVARRRRRCRSRSRRWFHYANYASSICFAFMFYKRLVFYADYLCNTLFLMETFLIRYHYLGYSLCVRCISIGFRYFDLDLVYPSFVNNKDFIVITNK